MEFRLLEPDDIELRVGVTKKSGFSLLLFKNARVDMQILDETVGTMNWQKHYELIDGQLFCTIEIWDAEKGQWIGKQDVGVESNTEAEKGRASDAQKRAAFAVGIGRELYSAPFVWINGHVEQDQRSRSGFKADQKYVSGLKVSAIEYTPKRSIKKLVIEDADGQIAYSYGVKRQKVEKPKGEEPKLLDPKTQIISVEHAEEIKEWLQETDSNVPAFLSLFQAKSVDEMYESQYEKAMQMLEKKRAKMKGDK